MTWFAGGTALVFAWVVKRKAVSDKRERRQGYREGWHSRQDRRRLWFAQHEAVINEGRAGECNCRVLLGAKGRRQR